MGFNALKNVCTSFNSELERSLNELVSIRGHTNFEDTVNNKLRDIMLYRAKLRFLRASLTPQITAQERDGALNNYEDTVVQHLIEQQLVKSSTQAHAVKKLITAPDSTLEPEMVERKAQIMEALSLYQTQESKVRALDALLREKEVQEENLRREWDSEMAWMREKQQSISFDTSNDMTLDNNLQKLRHMCAKLQLTSWLVTKLCVPPCDGYDWLNDPENRLNLLKMARKSYTVHSFVNELI